jgi:hypothetical protein
MQDGGYHVGLLHKDLASALDLDQYRVEVHDRYSVQSCTGKQGKDRVDGDAMYGMEYVCVQVGAATNLDSVWAFEPYKRCLSHVHLVLGMCDPLWKFLVAGCSLCAS